MENTLSEDYLAANIGRVHIATSCKDVCNVYRQKIKLIRTYGNSDTFPGVTLVGSEIMPVIDLRRRSKLDSTLDDGEQNIIAFQNNVDTKFAVVVDEIIGMKSFAVDNIMKANSDVGNKIENIDLLFSTIALSDNGTIYHVLDATYLDKIEPVTEDSGELEFF